MVEYPVTPAEHSSEETPRGTSSRCARWRASAGSPSWTGSSAPPADTPSVSGRSWNCCFLNVRILICLLFRIGMRPQLVLNEDEKKRRFKKFLSKKEGEVSNVVEDHQYSDDDSLHHRVNDMPPLEPIEANQKYPFKFPREIPFSCPFQPSTSTTLYNSPMYSSKHMNTSLDWKAQNPKSNRIPEIDILSGLIYIEFQ